MRIQNARVLDVEPREDVGRLFQRRVLLRQRRRAGEVVVAHGLVVARVPLEAREAPPRRRQYSNLVLGVAAGVRPQTRVLDQVVEGIAPRAPQVVRHVVRAVAVAGAVPRTRR